MGCAVKDINLFWQTVICAVLVMTCYSDEEPGKPLDIATIKRTSTDRSTTSKPGMRWEIARKR